MSTFLASPGSLAHALMTCPGHTKKLPPAIVLLCPSARFWRSEAPSALKCIPLRPPLILCRTLHILLQFGINPASNHGISGCQILSRGYSNPPALPTRGQGRSFLRVRDRPFTHVLRELISIEHCGLNLSKTPG